MKIPALAANDLRLTLRDRSSYFWIFVAPFLWVYFFGFLARGGEPGSVRLSLTVIQNEASGYADRLVETLRGENIALSVLKPGQAPATEDGEPARTLTIPDGFADAIARRQKVALDLRVRENANPEGTLAVRVAVHKAIVRLLAGEAFGGLDPATDAVTLRSSWAAAGRIPRGYYQTIPGNLVMFVLISTLTYGAAQLALERRNGMLRRMAVAPLTWTRIFAGKLLGRMAVASMQVGVFLAIGLAVFRIDWGGSPLGLAGLLVALIFCAASMSLLAGSIFASPEASSGVGISITLLMSAFGGCWWPAEVMPSWLRTAAWALPTSWAVNGLHEMISWGGRWSDILPHTGVLSLMGLAAAALAVRRLSHR